MHITKHTHARSIPPYLCLSVVSLWVLLETLGIYTDGGAHPATTAAHTKHQSGCIAEDDPQTLERDSHYFMSRLTILNFFFIGMT